MAEEGKTPYEQLLEENANLKKEMQDLRKEFNELRDFNRSLLSRNGTPGKVEDKEDTKKKFEAYLKGE